ncbi:hypothetical protein C479_10820 [Halovivax asiaticus JCM 14624]|uniref:Uncharacterized protein n=1 Tax=Halovivax asiaticus JCM 14624 TaxID=1227490 RepID=M0BG78_9EURY|nr:hypothetical protein [Halovivax asiaticus]ELZ09308.1 hypothetical protein C479_10820 [Halovivax asiaticus JCM 14624]
MHAVLTGDANLARESPTESVSYFVDQVDGTRSEPLPGTTAVVACWGDTAAIEREPTRAAVDADGTRATPAAEGHHWGTVCPTDDAYRGQLLDRIATVGANGDARLTTVGFPGHEFCHCERCDERFAASDHDDRASWRASVLTYFVADAADRVGGDLSVTLFPDPYPGASRSRTGLDPAALEPHVDEFVVPLCGNYETPYWVETLARGFGAELDELDTDVSIQLSVGGTGVDRLHDVTRMVEPHCDRIVYGTFPADVDTVEAVLDRRRTNDAVIQA